MPLGRTLGALGLALIGAAAIAAPAHAALAPFPATLPIDPLTGAPAFYDDGTIKLAECPPGSVPACGPAVPGESFWYQASSTMTTPGGGVATLTLNITKAPNASGNIGAFSRIRLQLDNFPAGTYTLTEPYGTADVLVASNGQRGRTTIDTPAPLAAAVVPTPVTPTPGGCTVPGTGPCDFNAALGIGVVQAGGTIGPFLTPTVAPAGTPAGFISDGVTPTPVTGGTTGNVFSLDACAGTCTGFATQSTTQFTVIGKLFGGFVPVFGSSGPVAFGTQLINTAATRTVTVHSNGVPGDPGSDLTLSSAPTLSAGAALAGYSITGGTCANALVMASGASCTVIVGFNPTTTGNKPATLTLTDAVAGAFAIPLTGAGGAPGISLSPGLDFLNQLVGSSSLAANVTVTNSGTTPLSIGTVGIGGTNPADFAVTFNSCAFPLAPSATCVIGTKFTPTAAGPRTATLTIASDASGVPSSLALNGNGTVAAVTLPPGPGVTPVIVVPKLSLLSFQTTGKVKLKRARKAGLRLVMRLSDGTKLVRIELFRTTGSKRVRISSAFRTPGHLGLFRVQLNGAGLRKALKTGDYLVEATPARSKTDLGNTDPFAVHILK